MKLAVFIIALTCVISYVYSNNVEPSPVLLSTNGNDYSNWASYAKKSEAKLDSILAKCFDCISEKHTDRNVCSNATGLNTVTKDGVINAGASFLNAAQALYTLAYPRSSYGYNYNMGANGNYGSQQTYQYNANPGYGNTYGTSYTNYYNLNPLAKSLSCMVGPEDQAVPMACEYGNSYCQISLSGGIVYSCAPVCFPSVYSICTTGALSNKWAPICLVGDLTSGSTGAIPQMCQPGSVCQINDNTGTLTGSCQFGCTAALDNTCYYTDFGNKQGPLCYVGTFGTSAELVGCGIGDFCVRTTAAGVVTGSCAASCTPSGTVACSTVDFGNKQGPICFVGQFGDYAVATACLTGQTCQRTTAYTSFGTSITYGSCATGCIPSATTFCCSTDLCNSYASEVNEYDELEGGYPIYGSGQSYGSNGNAPYFGNAANNPLFNKYASYNRQAY